MTYILLPQGPMAITSVLAVNWIFLTTYRVTQCAIRRYKVE